MNRQRIWVLSGLLSLPVASSAFAVNPARWQAFSPDQRDLQAVSESGYVANAHAEARGPRAGVHNGETYLRMVSNRWVNVAMKTGIVCGTVRFELPLTVGPDSRQGLALACGTDRPAAAEWSASIEVLVN